MKHLIAAVLLLVCGTVQAATIVYSPGVVADIVVTGIGGLDIGGTLYNVDFEAVGGAYSTFGGVGDFWGTEAQAREAVSALNTVLNAAPEVLPVNSFFEVLYQVNYGSSAIDSFLSDSWDVGSTPNIQAPFLTTAWTVVPLPAAVWLFGSGLGLLGFLRRKKS